MDRARSGHAPLPQRAALGSASDQDGQTGRGASARAWRICQGVARLPGRGTPVCTGGRAGRALLRRRDIPLTKWRGSKSTSPSNRAPFCGHLRRSRALILPDPQDGMVGTRLRAQAAPPAGGSVPPTPAVANATKATQAELLKGETAVQASDCRQCLDLSPGQGRAADLPVCRGNKAPRSRLLPPPPW